MDTMNYTHSAPLNGPAIKSLEDALNQSPNRIIQLEINNVVYQLSQEGRWFKFSRLTKKRAIKRSTIFETLTDLYNQAVHGHSWHLVPH